jgi:hypothetical protein
MHGIVCRGRHEKPTAFYGKAFRSHIYILIQIDCNPSANSSYEAFEFSKPMRLALKQDGNDDGNTDGAGGSTMFCVHNLNDSLSERFFQTPQRPVATNCSLK